MTLEELRKIKERQQQELEELRLFQKEEKQRAINEMNALKEQQRQREVKELQQLKEQQQEEIRSWRKANNI